MTARVLTGSKQEIADQVVKLEGDVREVIVVMAEPAPEAMPSGMTVDEFFAEMEPYTVQVGDVDDSREAIYERQEGE